MHLKMKNFENVEWMKIKNHKLLDYVNDDGGFFLQFLPLVEKLKLLFLI